MIFLSLLGVIILAVVIAIVLAMGGGTAATPTPTPSTSPTPTLNVQVRSLISIFGNPIGRAALENDATAPIDFRNALITAQPSLNQAVGLTITRAGSPLPPATFLHAIIPLAPTAVTGALGSDWLAMVYGQSEVFNTTGVKTTTTTAQNRLVLVAEATDATALNQAMQSWEATGLASASAPIFGFSVSKNPTGAFASGTYRQIPVRFLNFPYADQSLDWGIVLASNGKNYLVVSGSRQSFFWAIDQLMQ